MQIGEKMSVLLMVMLILLTFSKFEYFHFYFPGSDEPFLLLLKFSFVYINDDVIGLVNIER